MEDAAAAAAPAKETFRKSALGQTMLVGTIFLFVFSAYFMMQGYAALLFGPALASASLVTLYGVFAAACFVAPGIVNRHGGKRSLALGVVGYGMFSSAALAYSSFGEPAWARVLVIAAGGANGVGAALLWTAQGRVLLDCAARDPDYDVGRLFAVFWALFNLSAVFGGFVTFFYFSNTSSSGNAPLYLVFTVLIATGGAGCLLLEEDAPDVTNKDAAAARPVAEAKATLALFFNKKALLLLPLFWYTGYNQPYQLDGFGDRFFRERVVGLELAVFYGAEVLGGFVAGRALDAKGPIRNRALKVLAQFAVVTVLGNLIAGRLEYAAGAAPQPAGFQGVEWLAPTAAFAFWGFSDSQVQTYVYWLIGALYPRDAEARCRLVGFYKLVQSIGWCVGFALLPRARCAFFTQLVLTAASFVVGTSLALRVLPGDEGDGAAPLLDADAETAGLA